MEDQIDTLVANGFSRKLAIPTLYTYDSIPLGENMPNSDDGKWVYENYLF
ncbi:MAG: hypothetical protein LBF15_06305 [Candidatus Peribacteria bacterium]|nr:hypothetical protein [Candidatus Peribacteria bacterium]